MSSSSGVVSSITFAPEVKFCYVKPVSTTSLLCKMRLKKNISPDYWEINSCHFRYREGAIPDGDNYEVAFPYKWKDSDNGKWTYGFALIEGLTAGSTYYIEAVGVAASADYFSYIIADVPRSRGSELLFSIVNELKTFESFTDCIPVPNYNVNNVPIFEEWTDANYNTHSNPVQDIVKGTIELKFDSPERFKRFLSCMAFNEQNFGKGKALLRVHINNELDLDDTTVLPDGCINTAIYVSMFKVEWEPAWGYPFYGTSHDAGTITLTITEIES